MCLIFSKCYLSYLFSISALTKARTVMPDDVAEKNLATDGGQLFL